MGALWGTGLCFFLKQNKSTKQNKTRKQSTDLKDAFIYTADHSFVLFSHQMSRDCGAAWDSSHMFKCTIKANERKRGGGRKKERKKQSSRGKKKDWEGGNKKKRSHLEGFQQAHTVTRVIRRNMPPVDRMMYSELRPKPRWYRGREESQKENKRKEGKSLKHTCTHLNPCALVKLYKE